MKNKPTDASLKLDLITPERAANIRRRLMNAGVAVPESIELLSQSSTCHLELKGPHPESLRRRPKLEAAALNSFRTMFEERMPGAGGAEPYSGKGR
jgi:hypothetical protein